MAHEGIEIGEGEASLARGLRIFVIVVFLGVLVATAVVDRMRPIPAPALVGVEKAAEDQLRADATLLDGSLAKLVERDLQLTSRVRRWASDDYRLALYQYLGEASGERVVVGKDGWVFVQTRAQPPAGRAEKILERWATRLVAVDRCLADRGIRATFMPLPRRAVIEAQRLPRGLNPRPEIDRGAAEALRRHGLESVDLFPAFDSHQGPSLFYRADAHWNEGGELLAAEETLRQLGLLLPESEREGSIRRERFETQGTREDRNYDLLELLVGIEDPGGTGALRGEDVPLFDVMHPMGFKLGGHKQPGKMRALALTGTSFAARRNLALYLEHFGGARVWDGSFVGSGAISPIHQLLLRSGPDFPERLIAEVPVYSAFQGAQMAKQVSRMLVDLPPLFTSELAPVSLRVTPEAFATARVVGGEWENVLVTTRGGLLSTWDSLVGLRLRGEVLEGEIQISALDPDASSTPTWGVGKHEILLPLLAPSHASRPIQLRVRARGGKARFRLDEASFFTTLRRGEAQVLEPLRQGAAEGEWFSEFRLAPAPGDRALLVGPWSGELPPGGVVRVHVSSASDGEEPRQLLGGRMIEGGWLIGSLGESGRAGESLVRFSGPGSRFVPQISPSAVPVGAPKRE